MAKRRRKPQGPLYCCACAAMVQPRLTTGAEVYPRRSDLFAMPFWICECGNYVGCSATIWMKAGGDQDECRDRAGEA